MSLVVMCPHAEDFDGTILFIYLIHQSVLKIDAPGVQPLQIPNKLFKGGDHGEWVLADAADQRAAFTI